MLKSHLGTFARVWLARPAKVNEEDDSRVYALKVLRKVDGMLQSPDPENKALS